MLYWVVACELTVLSVALFIDPAIARIAGDAAINITASISAKWMANLLFMTLLLSPFRRSMYTSMKKTSIITIRPCSMSPMNASSTKDRPAAIAWLCFLSSIILMKKSRNRGMNPIVMN